MKLMNIKTSLICTALFTAIYNSNNNIEVTDYKIKSSKIPDSFNNFKILQISDLHDKEFGKKNIHLIEKIDSLKPDIIVITGDVLLRTKINYKIFYNLAYELKKRYDVYFISGNHEQKIYLVDKQILRFYRIIQNMGITILKNKSIKLFKDNSYINLWGIEIGLEHYRYGKKHRFVPFEIDEMDSILNKLNDKEFNILLAHNPLYFETYALWGADLVLSGHVHGGMIRLPYFGPLLSPERKLFPKYSQGKYNINNSTLIVNRGLGSGKCAFRLFNRPELSLITLQKNYKIY